MPRDQALENVAQERITWNPQCGFAPGSAVKVDIDEVYTKLKNEVAAEKIQYANDEFQRLI